MNQYVNTLTVIVASSSGERFMSNTSLWQNICKATDIPTSLYYTLDLVLIT